MAYIHYLLHWSTHMYKISYPLNVPIQILNAKFEKINGVNCKTFSEGSIIYGSIKSYGGSEKIIDKQYSIEDTIEVESIYTPELTSSCHIKLLDDNSEYEILNTPENIERRNLYLKFKARRVHGED